MAGHKQRTETRILKPGELKLYLTDCATESAINFVWLKINATFQGHHEMSVFRYMQLIYPRYMEVFMRWHGVSHQLVG